MSGLYIHIPFCNHKCAYCGFYSAVDSTDIADKYFDALLTDLKSRNKQKYQTLYIGGGTPSSVPYQKLDYFFNRLFDIIDNDFSEATIEGNPESINEDFLSVVEAYGFSRISVGCQSTDPDVLKHLTRIHSPEDIKKSVEQIRRICPDTALNLDMIYDIPNSNKSASEKTAEDLISYQPEHISAYTYSFDTGFLAGYESSEETEFTNIKQKFENSGYKKYEISNFARQGFESLHNINYWNLGDYDGVGASAWSLKNTIDKRILRGKISDISKYILSPESFDDEDSISGDDRFIEKIIFKLRMMSGADVNLIANECGVNPKKCCQYLNKLVQEGLLKWDNSNISLTEKGELLLDSVQEFLWSHLS